MVETIFLAGNDEELKIKKYYDFDSGHVQQCNFCDSDVLFSRLIFIRIVIALTKPAINIFFSIVFYFHNY